MSLESAYRQSEVRARLADERKAVTKRTKVLTETELRRLKDALEDGVPHSLLVSRFGIHRETIRALLQKPARSK